MYSPKKSMALLFNCLNINDHIIDLKSSKQPFYKPIYSLCLVKLKTFKTYIKANLSNKFIESSKFLAKILIFFV